MSNIKLFETKQIRSIWSEDDQKWYFSIIDVVAALTDSQNPQDYWYRIKQREKISGMELSTICRQFKLESPDGKSRETDCSHTEGLLRIIQSIPSPKAEPFKRWLAKVGYERLEEIENPELAATRMREVSQRKFDKMNRTNRIKKSGEHCFTKHPVHFVNPVSGFLCGLL
ncbi:MAG: Bro-N domain-containing protein [Gallionella sp.]|nr:Bro-N domain-containing protein [Gallionella sp.]